MGRYFTKPIFWIAALLVVSPLLVAALLCLPILLRHNRAYPHPSSDQERLSRYNEQSNRILRSSRPYGEVRIPFKEKEGVLCLEGVWAGRPTEAVLDTGSANVAWPVSWQLPGVWTDIFFKNGWAGGVTSENEVVILPSVKIGDFEMTNMPTTAFGRAQAAVPSTYAARIVGEVVPNRTKAILGEPAFADLVLTIDYQRQQIVLRGKTYDVTHLPRRPGDRLFSMSLANGYLPVINGQLGGMPARFGIDTGCYGIAVNGSFVKKLPRKMRISTTDYTAYLLDQPTKVRCLTQIKGFVGDLPFTENIVPTMGFPAPNDALVGVAFLKHYRVTIDYSRDKVLFEPYPVLNCTPQTVNSCR